MTTTTTAPEPDEARVVPLLGDGTLDAISGHGSFAMSDGCFVAVRPNGMIHSYGPAARAIDRVRDPLSHGSHSFRLAECER